MQDSAYVACFLAALAVASCRMAPVGSVVYRAWCETEASWIDKQWHLTRAEAEAQVELHRCEQPEHAVAWISTVGPVPTVAAEAPPNDSLRGHVFRRDR